MTPTFSSHRRTNSARSAHGALGQRVNLMYDDLRPERRAAAAPHSRGQEVSHSNSEPPQTEQREPYGGWSLLNGGHVPGAGSAAGTRARGASVGTSRQRRAPRQAWRPACAASRQVWAMVLWRQMQAVHLARRTRAPRARRIANRRARRASRLAPPFPRLRALVARLPLGLSNVAIRAFRGWLVDRTSRGS